MTRPARPCYNDGLMRNSLLAAGLLVLGLRAVAADGATCDYSYQLESDPVERARFEERAAQLNWAPPEGHLDAMTLDCLYCHDGALAPLPELLLKGHLADGANNAHSIGTVYYQGPSRTRDYRPPYELPALAPNMRFIQSKVGCLSCHDPLSTLPHYLVVPNNGSRLCLTCHVK